MLGWSLQELADRAVLSRNAIAKLERGEVDPRASTIQAVRRVLEKGGIISWPRVGARAKACEPPLRWSDDLREALSLNRSKGRSSHDGAGPGVKSEIR